MDMNNAVTDIKGLVELLKRYNGFGECIILDVRLRHYQTILEVVIDYIWDETGSKVRANAGEVAEMILFRFGRVQEIHFGNALNASMLAEPEQLNWGMNEIAAMRLIDDPNVLNSYRNLPVIFHQVEIRWENERRIQVVFADVNVTRIPNTPTATSNGETVL